MLDLLPSAVFERRKSESVRSDDRIRMNYDIIADDHARIDAYSRINYAVRSDLYIIADIYMLIYLGIVTYLSLAAYICKISDIHFLSYPGREPHQIGRAHV